MTVVRTADDFAGQVAVYTATTTEFTEEALTTVLTGNPYWIDDITIAEGTISTTTGISSISAEASDAAVYNLSGQKVSSSYKGVVIKNGIKVIQK